MIESGLSLWALANAAIQAQLGRSTQDVAKNIYSAFHFSLLPKMPTPLPAIILDRVQSREASDTLDARTAATTMLEGRFQFGCVAQDDVKNPGNTFTGYLAARELSQVLREQLLGLATGNSTLPDGTAISDLWIIDEFDAHFEVGGGGYLFRRALQVGMLFTEPEAAGAVGPPFLLSVYHGLSGVPGGITINAPALGVQLVTGGITSGNPLTAAVFAVGGPFQIGTFGGNWDGPLLWQKAGNASTYLLSGSIGGIAVVFVFYNVAFVGGSSWSN